MIGAFFKALMSTKRGGAVHEVVRMRQMHSHSLILTQQTRAQSMFGMVGVNPLLHAASAEAQLVEAICTYWESREIGMEQLDLMECWRKDEIPENIAPSERAYGRVTFDKTQNNDVVEHLPEFKTNAEFFRFFLKELCGYSNLIVDSNGFTDAFFEETITYIRRRPDLWR